jgi:hypothetical protein
VSELLDKAIHGWHRICMLRDKSILIYADCSHYGNTLALHPLVSELAEKFNTIYIVFHGNTIVPPYLKKHVEIITSSQLTNIAHIDAVISLGKPKSYIFKFLAANPQVLFAASAECV